ncbi:MAG TPA: RNA methyltransferase [Chitinophagaceae bacterium]|nr:RNA methyltransferase [Chitinophagaceae bacterium]
MTSIADAPGFDAASFQQVHQSGEQVTSVRLNPLKPVTLRPELVQSKIPWSTHGRYLTHRPSFTLDPLFHAGCYYVQEASSMFLEQAIQQTIDTSQTLKLLDLCAAPGGKSTLLQSIITPDSLLVSNEVIRNRSSVLQENITKWGGSNVVVTSNDPKDFSRLEHYFDVLVIDAPCSGSGLFRRDPSAIEEWSPANVMLCSQRQQRIVADALPSLKNEGVLVYCTCSYSVEEDEQVVDWLVDEFEMESITLNVDPAWGIVQSASQKNNAACYRFYPDKLKGEGFFLACLRKHQGESGKWHPSKHRTEKLSRQEQQAVASWIDPGADLHLFRHKEDVIAVPRSFEQVIPYLQERLYMRQAGTLVGKLARNELVPDHALAMSTIFNNAITRIPLNLDDALQYLRKAEVFPVSDHKGWALAVYEGFNLGWMKMLGNRLNNYYPKEWRILHYPKNP